MLANMDPSSSPLGIDQKISEDFDSRLKINSYNEWRLVKNENCYEDEEEDLEEEAEDEEEEEFSFVINGDRSSPISADDVFEDGQIRPVYPLFNQDLLLSHEDFKISESSLPRRPPVEKVFIETPSSPSASPSSSGKTDEIDGIAAGPYCEWTKTPELSKKSNSTGFSKLWRFKEYMHRSHSDGRDAFVFLNNPEPKKEQREVKTVQKKTAGEGSSEKKTVGDKKAIAAGEKKKVAKKTQKTKALSPHEIYLRSKGYNPEEDKRKSYLPYRPELVGFFTNVNGGLSKNVHPY